MRRFSLGSGTDRKIVVIELNGTCMNVVQMMPYTSSKRSEKQFGSEAEVRSASDKMARELISRGYAESVARGSKRASTGVATAKPAARTREYEEDEPKGVFDDIEAPAATAAPVLTRLASAPSVKSSTGDAPPKKKKGGKKKKKKAQSGDGLDKRVLAGVGAIGAVLVGIVAFIAYDFLLKPSTIVGVWQGSLVEHVISRSLTKTRYDLIVDDQRRAALAIQRLGEESTYLVGTCVVTGNRLKLALKDEDGNPKDREFKIALGHVTLDLYDPQSGELLVQMLRQRDKPVVRAHAARESKQAEPDAGGADTVNDSDEKGAEDGHR
jgi:hypothetical protein